MLRPEGVANDTGLQRFRVHKQSFNLYAECEQPRQRYKGYSRVRTRIAERNHVFIATTMATILPKKLGFTRTAWFWGHRGMPRVQEPVT